MKNNHLTTQSIELFVAGALGLSGFRALLSIPYYLLFSQDLILISSSLISGIALLIGIAILFGNPDGVYWARIYLWVNLVCLTVLILVNATHLLPSNATRIRWSSVQSLFTPLILLALLAWSRSKRFQSQAQQSGTGTMSDSPE